MEPSRRRSVFLSVITFLFWCLLVVICWPLALLAIIVAFPELATYLPKFMK